ncbi:MAG: YceI family protein [Bacteroidota bacterium]
MENTTKWVLDPAHSEILFKVRHLMITNVKGEFRNKSAEVITQGDDFSTAKIKLKIDANSIFTNDDNRDTHLKSAEFFNVEQYKEITFTGTKFEKINQEEFKLHGHLSMLNVSKEIVLDVDFGGINKDPWGNEKAGFSVSGKLNRKDWGLTWNAALETGGVMVSDEVKINAEIQFTKQK